MKILLLTIVITVSASLMGEVVAQSDGQKSKKGFLNRLFEEKDIDPETRQQVESTAKQMLENKETQDAVKEAAQALAGQESAKELLEVGQGLLGDPDAAMKKGSELSQDSDFLNNAAKTVEGMDPEALRNAAAKLAPLASDERVVAKAIAATSSSKPASLSPLEVPTPTDPVIKPIPRPNQDPSRVTKIIAEQAEFDANTNLVTFEDNVELDHPEFDLTCDILEAELKKQEGADGNNAVAPTQAAASGGIERAIASGYVVIEKLTPDGDTQVAKARRAVYESSTGNVVLMIFPQMQDGQNLIKGTSEATRIFLRPNGKYTVEGPAEITLVTPGDSNPLKLKPRNQQLQVSREEQFLYLSIFMTTLASQQPIQPTPQTAQAPQPNQNEFLLHTHSLKKVYDGRAVVNGVNINVRPGEIVGLLGPNGAGKTTTFYMIVGIVPPHSGKVVFNHAEVTHMPMYQRARLGMGYLPQEESIFRKLTVRENIMAVMETLDLKRKEKIERTDALMRRFGISHLEKSVALTLSGGEKRRLTIARSLVTEPSLLMLDEPFSGVDPIAVNDVQEIVLSLREAGLAILITDHNVREMLSIVDRAYLISEGKVVREGTSDFLINDPVSRELYLGERFSM